MFPAHHSLLSTISVLVVLLSPAHSGGGQFQLISPPQPLVAAIGDDVILPCHLEPAVDITPKTLEWTRPDLNPRFVHVRRAGQDLVHSKHPSYKGRTSLFTDELKRGNISLKLSDVRPSDAGRYRCFIPDMETDTFVDLLVASDAVSSPILTLAGIDKATNGVMLQCESAGWYPEPEVLWLDGEGNLLSAGPTETVRGPDDLYTVSSRVTVEKRHSNSFTCRVQQNNIHQTRETHISVSDDFFQVQSTYSSIITGLAVSLAVCILLIFAVVFKGKLHKIKTKRSHSDENDKEEKKNHLKTNRTEDRVFTKIELKPLKGKRQKKRSKHQLQEEQQRREEAEKEVQILKEELETRTTEYESELAAVQQQLQSLKEELETKNREEHDLISSANQDSVESHISVDEVDVDGKYVRLSNTSEEDQPMGDWELHIRVNNRKPIKYQFKPSFILKAGNTVTICASGYTVKSGDLKWSGQQPWGTGKQLLVTIYSNTGKVEVRKVLKLKSNLQQYITVSDIDLKGSYVRLSNTSKKDQPLKDWEIHIQVNDRKPIVYIFSSFTLKAEDTVTIWSSDQSDRSNPPTDLVWENQKSWGTGEQQLVIVYNNTGEEIAMKLKPGNITPE